MSLIYSSSPEGAQQVAEECLALGAASCLPLKADLGSAADIKSLFAATIAEYGKVDVLVNNAGITRDGLVLRMKEDDWQRVLDVNLSGVFYASQEFFKSHCKTNKKAMAGSCRIINISSVVGKFGNPGQANYSAAKAGVIGLTMSNAKEFSARGVCVNAVCPGFIESDMTAKLPLEYLQTMAKAIPAGRLGKGEEVAGLVKFLALDQAGGYITGQSICVDGGLAIGT